MEIFLKKSINHHWLSSPFKHHNFSKKQLSKTHWECHEFDSELLRIELVSVSMSFCFSRTACIAAFGTRRCDLQSWKVSHSRFSRKPNVKHLDSFRFICICSISYRHLHNVQSYMWTKLNKFNLYQYSIIVICPSGRSLCWCFCWQVVKQNNSCSSIGIEMMSPKGPTYQWHTGKKSWNFTCGRCTIGWPLKLSIWKLQSIAGSS